MERRVTRVAAVVHYILGCLVFPPNRSKLLSAWVRFAEVSAKTALTVMELLHESPP